MTTAGHLIAGLAAIVGGEHARPATPAELEDATRWVGLRGTADAWVEPGSAEEVARIVAWCYDHGVPITPRGGATGLAGGAVPDGGVVLSLHRLHRVRHLDPEWWRCEVEAGVTTADLQRRAREVGLRLPPNPGAAETSTIGGNLATNAGGPLAFGHGQFRDWVMSVEAVLPPGTLMRTGGPLRKDVAGYDLRALLVGSEGTLGIITAAWLRLEPPPLAAATAAGIVDEPAAVQDAVAAALASGARPCALELLDRTALRAAMRTAPLPGLAAAAAGADDPWLLTASFEDDDMVRAHAGAETVRAAWQDAGARWTAASDDAAALEAWRSSVSGAVAAQLGGKLSEDVVVPPDRLAELLLGGRAIAARHDLPDACWGHAGDGNVHTTFLLDPSDPDARRRAAAAADELFALVVDLGGSVTGEHGIGRLKLGQLERQLDPAALAANVAIKQALDPAGLLAPGRKLA